MTDNLLPHVQLADMSRWYVVSRAIHAVAKLGVANYMSATPTTVETLAKATKTQPARLNRLLKFLSAYQIFNDHHQAYSLTTLSYPLRDDDPHSIRLVLSMVDDYWWQAFAKLDDSLKSDKSAFFLQHQTNFFDFLHQHPKQHAQFNQGMNKLSSFDDKLISNAFRFDQFTSLLDLRAGRSGLTKLLAQQYPALPITLFDTVDVIKSLDPASYPNSICLKAGDLLSDIPKADAYLFKGVLHDFDESIIKAILKNCRCQMPTDSTLLVVEQLIPDNNKPHINKTMDIIMLTLLTGQQRTLSAWQEIIISVGFDYQMCYSTAGIFTVMVFKVKC